jgi:hypothetical protein
VTHPRRGARLRTPLALLCASLALAACGVARIEGPPVDDFSTWSAEPLPPDVALQAAAARRDSSCSAGPEGEPVRILVQDRRTEWTAAFLFAGLTTFGNCFLTSAAGVSSGGSGPLPAPISDALSIDVDSFGDVAGGKVRELGGRLDPEITSVVVTLADGATVTASVANGFWLAWWPTDVAAASISGFDGAGDEVFTLEVAA